MINKNRKISGINYEKLYGAAICRITLITELLRLCSKYYGEEMTNRVMRNAIAALDDKDDAWWERMSDSRPLGIALDAIDPDGKQERDKIRVVKMPDLWYRKRAHGPAYLRGQ